jgi:energy-coupling factor transporter ATP-binding protein EcfA2
LGFEALLCPNTSVISFNQQFNTFIMILFKLSCFLLLLALTHSQSVCSAGRPMTDSTTQFLSNSTSHVSSTVIDRDTSDPPSALSSSLITTFTIIFNGAIIGGIVTVARACWGLLSRFMSASLTIHEGTPAFEWIILMLSSCSSNHLRLNAKRSNSIATVTRSLEAEKRSIFGNYHPQHLSSILPQNTVCIGRSHLPSLPAHCRIFVSLSDASSESNSNKNGSEKQKVNVVCAGSVNGMGHIADLLKKAYELYTQSQREGTKLHVAISDRGNFYWRNVGTRPARLLQSVICDDGIAQTAYSDMKDFLEAATWYADRGIPYRRGYLLYGEPGTGKSSLVMALAGTLKMPVYQVSLTEQTLTDSTFTLLLNAIEPNSVVLLEDVDAAFCDRTSREGSSLSFSGILNAIDGVAASEARILFMTTNHIEKLDPALIRPGRIDVKFEMTLATQPMIAQMFRHFYSHGGCASSSQVATGSVDGVSVQDSLQHCNIHAMSETFSRLVPSKKFSMASVQVYLMQHKRDPAAALARAALHFQPSTHT